MKVKIGRDDIYRPSGDIVAREIEGELIIIPLVAGMGDAEDELFTLNPTGRAVWRMLDGKNSVRQIVERLCREYSAEPGLIGRDVKGILAELHFRKFIAKKRRR